MIDTAVELICKNRPMVPVLNRWGKFGPALIWWLLVLAVHGIMAPIILMMSPKKTRPSSSGDSAEPVAPVEDPVGKCKCTDRPTDRQAGRQAHRKAARERERERERER